MGKIVRSDEWKRKQSLAQTGKTLSKETRGKISVATSGKNNGFYGHTHTEENKEKMRYRGRVQSAEEKLKRSESCKKFWMNNSKKKQPKLCECGCGDMTFPGRRFISGHNGRGNHVSSRGKGWHHSQEAKDNISKGQKSNLELIAKRRAWGHKLANIALRKSGRHPNKVEKFLGKMIQSTLPNEFKYTGNGTVIIEGCNPDFTNINGKKQVIELFGTYWHGEKKTGRTKEQEENLRKSHFAKYGFSTLIIWEEELKIPEMVINKLKVFNTKNYVSY